MPSFVDAKARKSPNLQKCEYEVSLAGPAANTPFAT